MSTQMIERLAANIGEAIYIDVANWHLLLSDAHLHTQVAEKIYFLLEQGTLDESQVQQILEGISVKLGGGKLNLPLVDLIPAAQVSDLMDISQNFKDKEM
ncbi:MAG: DUF3181 family protein [Microcoleaceae cyanobacterium]